MPKLTAIKKLEIFQKIFVDDFMREFNFLADVAAGRAAPKNDFIDKLCKILALGLTTAGTALDNAAPLAGTIPATVITQGLEYVNDGRKAERAKRIGRIYDLLTIDSNNWAKQQEELRILVENVAREAAYRYQSTIVDLLSDDPLEGIVPLAKICVERTLEFVVRKNLELTEENLLQGLIEGRSGAFVTQYFNTSLATKTLRSKESDITAEGVLGRAPFKSLEEEYYTLSEDKAVHKKKFKELKLTQKEIRAILKNAKEEKEKDLASPSKFVKFKALLKSAHLEAFFKLTEKQITQLMESCYDYGYVHSLEDKTPKYPFVHMPKQWIDHYGYEEMPTTRKSKEAFDAKSKTRIKVVEKKEVENYLKYIQTSQKSAITFNAYIKMQYPDGEVAACHADLRGLDLSGTDFSGSDLSKCVFDRSLNGAKFNGSNLRDITFEKGTTAIGTEFKEAHLEYLKAEGIDFSGANFTQTYLNHTKLQKANLSNIKAYGTEWFGADLEEVTVENLAAIIAKQKNRLTKLDEKLKSKIKALNDRAEKQATEVAVARDKIEKLEQTSQEQAAELKTILDNLLVEHDLRETFELYCRSELASLNENMTELEANESKAIKELEQRLELLQRNQQMLPSLLEKIGTLATHLQEQKQQTIELQKEIALIKQQSEEYIASQSQQISLLHEGLTGLEITVIDLARRVAKIEEDKTKKGGAKLADEIEMHDSAKIQVLDDKADKQISGTAENVSKLVSNPLHSTWDSFLNKPRPSDAKVHEKPQPVAGSVTMHGQAQLVAQFRDYGVHIDLKDSEKKVDDSQENSKDPKKQTDDSQGTSMNKTVQ